MQQPTSVSIFFAEKDVNEFQGISGIRISNQWILTHGMLLKSKILNDTKLFDMMSNLVPGVLTYLPLSSPMMKNYCHLRVQTRPWITKINEKVPDVIHEMLEIVNGSIIFVWRCPLLVDIFDNLFYGWNFGEDTRKINKILMTIFILVRIDDKCENNTMNNTCNVDIDDVQNVLGHLINHKICIENFEKGALVQIESTPFGNSIFIDSISQGIVSNILGTNNCVMLTDANTAPGCEGGPVYLIQQKNKMICGMVIAPLSWYRNEWVYYTFVACIIPCLRRLLRKWENIKNVNGIIKQNFTELLDESVVLVRCGVEWGSGILLDRDTGTILTCSHVVNEASNERIKVVFHRNPIDNYSISFNTWAKLIYRTPKGQPYDVAVLKVDSIEIDSAWRTLRIGDCNIQRGELVISAGFPFFSSTLPTITRGNVSNVNECMLQTTCCVQRGASGGPIIRPNTGELLGMVVCNVISSNILYPKLNMAVPATVLKGPINEYIKTGDAAVLETLTCNDNLVLQTWNFHLPSKL